MTNPKLMTGEVVVDLPVRAPRPPPEPHRYDHLPINAPPRPVPDADGSAFELDPRLWPSRSRVVAIMTVRAALGLLAAGVLDAKLLLDVLPSASLAGGIGVVAPVVLATLLAVDNSAASRAAILRKARRP